MSGIDLLVPIDACRHQVLQIAARALHGDTAEIVLGVPARNAAIPPSCRYISRSIMPLLHPGRARIRKGLPVPGMPALQASKMTGFPTVTAILSPF